MLEEPSLLLFYLLCRFKGIEPLSDVEQPARSLSWCSFWATFRRRSKGLSVLRRSDAGGCRPGSFGRSLYLDGKKTTLENPVEK